MQLLRLLLQPCLQQRRLLSLVYLLQHLRLQQRCPLLLLHPQQQSRSLWLHLVQLLHLLQ